MLARMSAIASRIACSGMRAIVLLCFTASLAWAAPRQTPPEGISIAWLDCRAPGTGFDDNRDFGCQGNIGSFPLYPALRLATTVDSVFTVELVIDVDVAADPMPAGGPWTAPAGRWLGLPLRKARPTATTHGPVSGRLGSRVGRWGSRGLVAARPAARGRGSAVAERGDAVRGRALRPVQGDDRRPQHLGV